MSTPTQKRALSVFYENLAQVQRDANYYLNPIGLSRRDAILSLLQAQSSDVIGDLGCGEGLITVKLRGRVRRLIGCDLSPTRVRRAMANGVEAVSGDVLHLPFPDAFFDKIICTEVVEHVMDPAAALAEIFRVLCDGGAAILTVPLDEHLDRTLLDVPEGILASSCYHDIKAQFELGKSHLHSFAEESFQELVAGPGFDIEGIAFTHNYTLKYPHLLRSVRRLHHAIAGHNPAARLSQLFEAFIRPLIDASYHKEETKHHIVVRAGKPRSVR